DAGVEDAGWNESKDELDAVDVHRVSGVVPPLIPRHDRKVPRQQIDDLSFPFISPLRTKNRQIHRNQSHLDRSADSVGSRQTPSAGTGTVTRLRVQTAESDKILP